MSNKFFDLMFTESVKAAQEHYGSRTHYSRFDSRTEDFKGLDDLEKDFIESRDGFYIATVNENGQPYIQFRGGSTGFLKILDDTTLGYADFRGNLQYVSVGNIAANDHAALFLMDYANQRRLKILARVEVNDAEDVPEFVQKLQMPEYKAKIERAMMLHVEAFDWNCPQHITPRYTIGEITRMITPMTERLEQLEKENIRLNDLLKSRT